ncbi:MAG: DUF1934 domain-containing protein [Lachnospiraceae bacterium]|nr:DUF1934 domain-containing protein [Lachnospiraceae bacterium]
MKNLIRMMIAAVAFTGSVCLFPEIPIINGSVEVYDEEGNDLEKEDAIKAFSKPIKMSDFSFEFRFFGNVNPKAGQQVHVLEKQMQTSIQNENFIEKQSENRRNKMQRKVHVSVTGIQYENGVEMTSTQTLSTGTYEKHEEKDLHTLIFDERIEGIDTPLKNIIILSESEVNLLKSGELESEMLFSPGQTTLSSFHTPYGDLSMDVLCSDIKVWENQRGVYGEINYQLFVEGKVISENKIKIEAKY